MAVVTIWGLYAYDPTLFDDMYVPDGVVKSTLINTILLHCSGLEVLYTSAPFMKQAITFWSEANMENFQKMADTMNLEYNPIWNKDGTITEETTTRGNNSDIASVKGFNSDSWAEAGRNEGSAAGSSLVTRRESGNIGVTTTQQMIKEEREISEFSIYSYIADRFRETFCLLVY